MGGGLQIPLQGLTIATFSLILSLFFSLDTGYLREVDLFRFLYDFNVFQKKRQ